MKRKLLLFVPSVVVVLTVFAGPAGAYGFIDNDCDGYDDNTGQSWREYSGSGQNGVCGGGYY